MLAWATQVSIFCFLDNHHYPARLAPGVECLLAVGAAQSIGATAGQAFSRLKAWAGDRREWLFGHFAYDLVTETEPDGKASSSRLTKPDPIGFPDLFFFIPEILIELGPEAVRIGCLVDDPEMIWREINNEPSEPPGSWAGPDLAVIPAFTPRFTRAEYQERVGELQRHIRRGDCYEINFCQEFFSHPADLDPLRGWQALSQASPNPFACFYRLQHRYLLCASPERYLKKTGDQLFSQPIKGTSARSPNHPAGDHDAARELFHSGKDRAENVMVVDLVRNDLSKICVPGTVQVQELYGIYPFPQVYQMISTISGTVMPDLHWTDAIRETFPMGSMTGAPKHRVVELIDQYERSRRGIFSGAVGYVTPEGDFDFNVVIRSLLYNQADGYLSYQVGSGITFYSNAEAEYAECMVKAQGILSALGRP